VGGIIDLGAVRVVGWVSGTARRLPASPPHHQSSQRDIPNEEQQQPSIASQPLPSCPCDNNQSINQPIDQHESVPTDDDTLTLTGAPPDPAAPRGASGAPPCSRAAAVFVCVCTYVCVCVYMCLYMCVCDCVRESVCMCGGRSVALDGRWQHLVVRAEKMEGGRKDTRNEPSIGWRPGMCVAMGDLVLGGPLIDGRPTHHTHSIHPHRHHHPIRITHARTMAGRDPLRACERAGSLRLLWTTTMRTTPACSRRCLGLLFGLALLLVLLLLLLVLLLLLLLRW
jgi:hypothetical protein